MILTLVGPKTEFVLSELCIVENKNHRKKLNDLCILHLQQHLQQPKQPSLVLLSNNKHIRLINLVISSAYLALASCLSFHSEIIYRIMESQVHFVCALASPIRTTHFAFFQVHGSTSPSKSQTQSVLQTSNTPIDEDLEGGGGCKDGRGCKDGEAVSAIQDTPIEAYIQFAEFICQLVQQYVVMRTIKFQSSVEGFYFQQQLSPY